MTTINKNINNMRDCTCGENNIEIKNCIGQTIAICNNCGHKVILYHKTNENIVSLWNKSFNDESDIINIKDLVQTCLYCPSQWQAKTIDGKDVYIRYRWGVLTLEIDDKLIKTINYGNGIDGCMETEEMKTLLSIKEG